MTDDGCLLILRAFRRGHDTTEIARLFNVSEGKVWSALHWARILEAIGERTENDDQGLPPEGWKARQNQHGEKCVCAYQGEDIEADTGDEEE